MDHEPLLSHATPFSFECFNSSRTTNSLHIFTSNSTFGVLLQQGTPRPFGLIQSWVKMVHFWVAPTPTKTQPLAGKLIIYLSFHNFVMLVSGLVAVWRPRTCQRGLNARAGVQKQIAYRWEEEKFGIVMWVQCSLTGILYLDVGVYAFPRGLEGGFKGPVNDTIYIVCWWL